MSRGTGDKGELVTQDSLKDGSDNVTYGKVIKMLGSMRVLVYCCSTSREHQCIIRGGMRNKSSMTIVVDDIVLVSLREFESKATGDIILRYTLDERAQLRQLSADVMALTSTNKSMIDNTEITDEVVFDNI